jgi:hypothetical protein
MQRQFKSCPGPQSSPAATVFRADTVVSTAKENGFSPISLMQYCANVSTHPAVSGGTAEEAAEKQA